MYNIVWSEQRLYDADGSKVVSLVAKRSVFVYVVKEHGEL